MNTINKKITLALIFIAGLALGAGGFYSFQAQDSLSPEKASEAAMGFINKSLEQDNVTASLVSVAEESGISKLHLTIESNEYDSFMSKDGKYLFSTAFDLNAEKVKAAAVSLETLAKCLTENGAKFYGAFWPMPALSKKTFMAISNCRDGDRLTFCSLISYIDSKWPAYDYYSTLLFFSHINFNRGGGC